MSGWELLGAGVLLAWLGLPLLALPGPGAQTEPGSRHRQRVLVLGLGALLLAVPALRSLIATQALLPATEAVSAAVARAAEVLVPDAGPGPLVWVARAWLLLTVLATLHALARLWRLGQLLERARPAPEADSILALRVARRAGLPPPRLLLSDEVSVPFAASLWRPAVVVPVGLRERLSDEAFQCVLAHEVAHLARGDQGWALLVALLRLPFALHPTARALAADLALAREEAVDAQVAHDDAHTYAHALVTVAALAGQRAGTLDLVSMSATALQARVAALADGRARSRAMRWPTVVLASLVGALAFGAPLPPSADPAPAGVSGPSLTVAEGMALELDVGADMQRVAVGDPEVVDVGVVSPGRLSLLARAPGTTTLLVWSLDGSRKAWTLVVPPR
jgi:beta-lactamase regulating signal transducer with metallopeptidase domain